jgi:hypothetical protein
MLFNFLVRLVAYPFCVVIIIFGYQMVFDTPQYSNPIYVSRAKFFGVIGIGMALVYLISDSAYQIKKTFFKPKD